MKLKISNELKEYASPEQFDLMREGLHLIDHVNSDRSHKFNDYSFIVFPFAKAYEGFLKQVFLDAGYITRTEYKSKFFRVGKVLSPNLLKKLGKKSVYNQICKDVGCDLSERVWRAWRRGRNQVFHYFPHNLRSLTLHEAEEIVLFLITTMDLVVKEVSVKKIKRKLNKLTMHEARKIRAESHI